MEFEKYMRDGMVAVLYSPGYGAGWYSWNQEEKGLLFDKRIVEKVLSGHPVTQEFMESLGYTTGYYNGARDLRVEWVRVGQAFRIDEYDGNETVVTSEQLYETA